MPVQHRQQCQRAFFDRHHLDVARDLLGCELVWDGVGGMIVETESYAAENDDACHTSFRPSARTFFESKSPGTVYAYINYGVHWLLNVLTRDGIVLFRALEPTRGIEFIRQRRGTEKPTALCSGPGKLGKAINLGPADHGTSLLSPDRFIIRRSSMFDETMIVSDLRTTDSPMEFILQPWQLTLIKNQWKH